MPLKYLSNFWKTLKMLVIDCQIDLISIWSEGCITSSAAGAAKLAITDAKLYVSIVTLSTEDNIKLLQQLESGFKRTISWNKYQPKLTEQPQHRYLNYLIQSFEGVNRLFVLSLENRNDRKVRTGYFLPKAEIKD